MFIVIWPSDCQQQAYICDNIIIYIWFWRLGHRYLSFYQWNPQCDLAIKGCDINVNNNTAIMQSVPNALYNDGLFQFIL